MFTGYLKETKKVNKGSPYCSCAGKWRGFVFSLCFFMISGCASIPVKKVDPVSIDLFPGFKRADGSLLMPRAAIETLPDVDILAINDDIKKLIDEKVKGIREPQERLVKLTQVLGKLVKYDIESDLYGVKTAQQTFDTGTGNCLSFSNLFVAAARYAGLASRFSEIPVIPAWSRDGETLFFTRHIGAVIDIRYLFSQVIHLRTSNDKERLVTVENTVRYFFLPSERTPEESRYSSFGHETVSDERAFAQYYNNMGSKHLAEGNTADAYRYFVKAIKVDPGLSYSWSNLGVVYKRNNQFEAVESAYLQGLSVTRGPRDTSLLSIMSNLAHLYQAKGDEENARFYMDQVAAFRNKNPYYQYAAGKDAYYDAFYEKSIGFFRDAIRLKRDEHLFYYGLALAYHKTGDIKKAEANISQAITYALDQNKKGFYEKALESLKKSGDF